MKSQNFEFLRPHWPELASLCGYAEQYMTSDPQSALVKLRCFGEKWVAITYGLLDLDSYRYRKFIDRLENAQFIESIGDPNILDKLDAIRKVGNRAVHEGRFHKQDPLSLLKEAQILSYWLLLFAKKGCKEDIKAFVTPENADVAQTAKQASKHQQQLKQALDELEATKKANEQIVKENAQLKVKFSEAEQAQRIEQNRKASTAAISLLELNEAQTRKLLIDRALYSAGWDIDLINEKGNTAEVKREFKVSGQPTESGEGHCDYVLWGDNGKPIAVIEAKRTRESAQNGLKQACLYAEALEQEYDQCPVIFLTNGKDIFIQDSKESGNLRKIYDFYSKESVEYLLRQRVNKKDLLKTPIDTDIAGGGGRAYQIEAITRICERYSQGYRKALAVQATGTGKTRVAIALSKRMIEAGWAKRVLFLCDRKELRKQASKAYNEFLSEPVYTMGKSKRSDRAHSRIVIATYPSMLGAMGEFDPGYFDLIIADESHRSVYNVFGDLFKYFDALQLGLTATPIEMVSRSTTSLFGCEYKQPTSNYSLEQAVEEKHLTPFKVVSHTTQFLRDGIKSEALSDEQIAALEEQGVDPNELDFESGDIEKAISNKDTNREILRNLMERGLRMADGQTLGKTIIFARNISHAESLSSLFKEMYPSYAGQFCQVIHSKFERAEQLIDDFKRTDDSNEKITIAISVDMLDTGIDVPEILNLVFAKPVKSKVKFWQMVGRGTRKCDNLFGIGQHKNKFLIFDHWDNFEYFKIEHDEEEVRQSKSQSQKLFEGRVAFAATALRKAEMSLFNSMIKLIKQDIDELDDNCIAIKDNWKIKAQYQDMAVLEAFAPVTRNALYDRVAPLMQWKNIKGQNEALNWDLEVLNAQESMLEHGEVAFDVREKIQYKASKMAMSRNEVRKKADTIRVLQQDNFWGSVDFDALENARLTMRDVIHLREKDKTSAPLRMEYDIPENKDHIQIEERNADIPSVDYEIYRQEVEKTLQPLFESSPVLIKIRQGQSVTDEELNQLNALVHTQNERVDLNLLTEFFPDSSLDLSSLLRVIVGMDVQAISNMFAAFIEEHHLTLNSTQQRFIALLKQEICRLGQFSVERLYQPPFKTIHQDGIDGVFKDEQATLIANFVTQFALELGKIQSQVFVTPQVNKPN